LIKIKFQNSHNKISKWATTSKTFGILNLKVYQAQIPFILSIILRVKKTMMQILFRISNRTFFKTTKIQIQTYRLTIKKFNFRFKLRFLMQIKILEMDRYNKSMLINCKIFKLNKMMILNKNLLWHWQSKKLLLVLVLKSLSTRAGIHFLYRLHHIL
jgi:hypothetical protein